MTVLLILFVYFLNTELQTNSTHKHDSDRSLIQHCLSIIKLMTLVHMYYIYFNSSALLMLLNITCMWFVFKALTVNLTVKT